MDNDLKNRLADYFTAAEIVEYLEGSSLLTVEDVIDVYEEEIEDVLDDLIELMDTGTKANNGPRTD